MANFKAKQSGTFDFATTDSSKTATITSIDTTKSFLRFTWSTTGTSLAVGAVRGQITDSTTLTFTRNTGTTVAITVEWQVMEWSSGVTVQRGSQTGSAATTNVIITAVDTAKAWPIVTWSSDNTTWSTDYSVSLQASITSTTNLALVSDDSTPTAQITEWQVIEYDNSTVALYSKTIARNSTGGTQTITSVDTTATILYGTAYVDDDPSAPENQPRWTLTNATTITWVVDDSGNGNAYYKMYVVSFSDLVSVQRAVTSVASGDTTNTITVTSLGTTRTLVSILGFLGTWAYVTYNTPGFTRSAFTLVITNATTLTYDRETSGTAATLSWESIQFPAGTVTTAEFFGDHATGRGVYRGVMVGIG
jgi:hypothetical protein